jgi:hypothetical protein
MMIYVNRYKQIVETSFKTSIRPVSLGPPSDKLSLMMALADRKHRSSNEILHDVSTNCLYILNTRKFFKDFKFQALMVSENLTRACFFQSGPEIFHMFDSNVFNISVPVFVHIFKHYTLDTS